MRVDHVDPADMTDEQRTIYDRYATEPRAAPDNPFLLVGPDGRLQGPPAVWILSPVFGQALQQIGAAVRFGSRLPARACEIAILLVGHARDSPFELYAHQRAGAAAGLTGADLAALADGREPAALSEVESCVLRTTRLVLDRGSLDDEQFRDAAGVLGEAGLFELVTIIGYYTMVAWQLAVFDVQPPDA
ncbi:carboxymuconolactone decarboxylase family protein [Dactylosporangium sp. AC04546]|uniref:carboxymuconolactone decarboxylase family protein n=1 Tax=Dactylosporangium sp. AC04546 TaxID=2862460 RepID=UPI001EDF6FD6|nr:carboxymuconolactone decarboxylase family protein [Dactylosporangium sp. AC04546]WVK89127.1 carboxymuconolactone decarboxylase family protein [Dactylosporangium sp. AC04546]